jgi:hypothetical protein
MSWTKLFERADAYRTDPDEIQRVLRERRDRA